MKILYEFDGIKGDKDVSTVDETLEIAKNALVTFILGLQNLSELDDLLSSWEWGYEVSAAEFINLGSWIQVLNKVDECLNFILREFGDYLIISVLDECFKENKNEIVKEKEKQCADALHLATTLLTWTSDLLSRAIHKEVYNSLEVSRIQCYF
jgi:enolase